MATEIERMVRQLNKSFNKGAWHGPTVKEVLAQVKPEQAHHHAGKSHSIIELVLHMTAWRTFAIKRLQGDDAYQVSDEMNFPQTDKISWQAAVQNLEKTQQVLEVAVGSFPEERLNELVPSIKHKYTYYTLIHGILQHDIYHIGQIQLILKANLHFV